MQELGPCFGHLYERMRRAFGENHFFGQVIKANSTTVGQHHHGMMMNDVITEHHRTHRMRSVPPCPSCMVGGPLESSQSRPAGPEAYWVLKARGEAT